MKKLIVNVGILGLVYYVGCLYGYTLRESYELDLINKMMKEIFVEDKDAE